MHRRTAQILLESSFPARQLSIRIPQNPFLESPHPCQTNPNPSL
jgi:hypothetical protein